MTGPNNKEELLADVLAEAPEAGFHEALLDETLRLAHRRRRIRQMRRAGGMLAALAVIVATAIWRSPREPGVLLQPVARGHQLVLTQPLPVGCIVSTRPLPMDQMVVSTAVAGVVQTTADSGGYHELGDDELLALVPEPAALVRRGAREAELVFVPLPAAEDSHQN